MRTPVQVYPKAMAAVTRALSIDGGLSDAHSLYADILTWYDRDFDAAEREYHKTLELDPLNVLAELARMADHHYLSPHFAADVYLAPER